MRVEWTAASDPPEVKRCLRDYELQDSQVREARMQALADLPDGQGTAALCRLVRFEKSAVLSKYAARRFAWQSDRIPANPTPPRSRRSEGAGRLQATRRRVAFGLDADLADQPEAAMSEWGKLIDQEREVLRNTPKESAQTSSPDLIRFRWPN